MGKDGGTGRLYDLEAMRFEFDVLTRMFNEISDDRTLPEARFAALVGEHIRGARAAIPLDAKQTESRIREIVDGEIARAFGESGA